MIKSPNFTKNKDMIIDINSLTMMDSSYAHILSDEASAGSVVVGTGISATLLLFFEQSLQRMLPYLVIAAVVILIDLVFGIRAARRKGDRIRISRAIRRTVGKAVEYFCWAVLASSLAVATGYAVIETGLMLVVIGVELISIAQNWYFWKFGHKARVKVDAAKVIEAVVQAKTGANIEGAVSIEKGEGENKKEAKDDGDDQ